LGWVRFGGVLGGVEGVELNDFVGHDIFVRFSQVVSLTMMRQRLKTWRKRALEAEPPKLGSWSLISKQSIELLFKMFLLGI
jgi:hypothetical protein